MKDAAFVLSILLLPLLFSPTVIYFMGSFSTLMLILVVFGVGIFYIFNTLWLKSTQRLRWKLKKQGINRPSPSFLYGNVAEMQKIQAATLKTPNYGEFVAHDYTSSLFPYFEQWRKLYDMFVDVSSKLGEVATAISRIADTRLDVKKLHEEVMSTEGYEEAFLSDAVDFLVESDPIAKAFMVKSQALRKLWLDKFKREHYDTQ